MRITVKLNCDPGIQERHVKCETLLMFAIQTPVPFVLGSAKRKGWL